MALSAGGHQRQDGGACLSALLCPPSPLCSSVSTVPSSGARNEALPWRGPERGPHGPHTCSPQWLLSGSAGAAAAQRLSCEGGEAAGGQRAARS